MVTVRHSAAAVIGAVCSSPAFIALAPVWSDARAVSRTVIYTDAVVQGAVGSGIADVAAARVRCNTHTVHSAVWFTGRYYKDRRHMELYPNKYDIMPG